MTAPFVVVETPHPLGDEQHVSEVAVRLAPRSARRLWFAYDYWVAANEADRKWARRVLGVAAGVVAPPNAHTEPEG